MSVEGGEIPSIGGEESPPVHPLPEKRVTTPSVPFLYKREGRIVTELPPKIHEQIANRGMIVKPRR